MATILGGYDTNAESSQEQLRSVTLEKADTKSLLDVATFRLPLAERRDYDGGNFPIYEGFALPGTTTSAAGWAIRKFTWSGTQNTTIEWADGNGLFDNVWDDRTGLSYS